MKDIRISVRLSESEHEKLKILTAKKHTTINNFMLGFIQQQINGDLVEQKNIKHKGKVLSLFANIGVAEAYLEDIGVNVVLANELVSRRAELYKKIYPHTEMKIGDITSLEVQEYLINRAKELDVDIIMATPPCQGMSTAGKQDKEDVRNSLIVPVVRIVDEVKPKYVMIENVPMILQTSIEIDGKEMLIIDFLKNKLQEKYFINIEKIDTKDYGVPQSRERVIILLTRKDTGFLWKVPQKDANVVTMRDAIGNLPQLDPFIKDVSENELLKMFPDFYSREKKAKSISKWHVPPVHIKRQVEVMQHTPTGCTAFDNIDLFKPRKENGELVKGFRNTFKRQVWDTPAFTVTMDNRKISSQNNVHPGHFIGTDERGNIIYSDPRALTLYELMLISSIPKEWPIPANTSTAFLRSVIGEGIPPLFVKKVFLQLGGAYERD